MGKVCQICGKRPQVGNKVSHSARKTLRRFMPNLQRVRAYRGNVVTHMNVCTSCIRANKVRKAP